MKTLILTPTQLEYGKLDPVLMPLARRTDTVFALCGFGPIAAAARTMQLIGIHQPTNVILIGIAGSLRADLGVGTARSFQRVVCDGIGVGTGASYKSASEIGWNHWVSAGAVEQQDRGISDVLSLAATPTALMDSSGDLLTVCTASANEADVAMRLERHPGALAEEMEGFGVAVACYFGGVPLQIIRGISNRAGDRDKTNWNVDAALDAASQLALRALSM